MKHNYFLSFLTGAIALGMVACTAPTVSVSSVATPAAGETVVVATEVVAADTVTPEVVAAVEAVTDAGTVVTEAPAESATATSSASLPADATLITLGDEISIAGAGAEVSETGVRIIQAGNYVLQGVLADGIVEVDAPNAEVHLYLNGISITNSRGPAIVFYASSASNVTLVEGTTNTLVDGGEHDDYDATLWSSATLTIDGEGDLVVTGNYQEGIASEMHININGGNIWVSAFDDGLNANNDDISIITINDGYLFVNSGGDGLDSNGAIVFNGGTTIAMSALTDMSGGIDADGDVTINGGTVIATGARNSVPVAASAQESLVVSYTSTQAAETLAAIVDANGEPLLLFAPEVAYQQLVFSSAEVAEGVTYTVYSGGSAEGEAQDGWYASATYTPGVQVMVVDTTSVTNAQNMGPRGGRP